MPSIKELEQWMSVKDAAERLGASRQGVRHLADARRIRGAKTAIGWLFDPASVEELAEKRASPDPVVLQAREPVEGGS